MRNEPVIAGIAHRSVEETIDDQRAAGLVHFVFDRLAADRDFDDDVDFLGRVGPDGYGVQIQILYSRPVKPNATRSRVSAPNRSGARRTTDPPSLS